MVPAFNLISIGMSADKSSPYGVNISRKWSLFTFCVKDCICNFDVGAVGDGG
jgi:hypothetical protein